MILAYFIITIVIADGGFSKGLARQRALKSLSHQDLNLMDVTFDWLDSPTIRFAFTYHMDYMIYPKESLKIFQ